MQPVVIETFNAQQAAKFLGINKEVLRQRTAKGEIPGAKVGRSWVYVNIDLIDYIRASYRRTECDLQSVDKKEENEWHSEKEAKHGTSISDPGVASEYENLLELPIDKKRKSTTTK